MPGRLFLLRSTEALAGALGVSVPGTPDPPRANIAPGQHILTLTPEGLTRMRWGMIPVGRVNARGRPVMEVIVNARGETLFEKSAFSGTGRALIPADGWYEWTGTPRRKTAWRIWPADGAPLTFAAITDVWTAPGGALVPQVAAVTCPPSVDVEALHDRMGVIVSPADRQAWLTGTTAEARALIRPAPEGTLLHAPAVGVDFSGA